MSEQTPEPQEDSGKTRWWSRRYDLPLWGLLLGGFVLIGIGGIGSETEEVASPTETRTVTETVTAEAEPGEQVTVTETVAAEPSPEEVEPPPEEGGAYTAGQYELTDVQLSEDFGGDFAGRARITNNGDAVDAVIIEMSVFKGGSVIATLDGTSQDFGAGETRTIEFSSLDDWDPDWDEVEFQVGAQF